MVDDYAKYEEEKGRIRADNEKILAEFEAWLRNSNLKDVTIGRHVENIDFYINEFLLYEDTIEAKDGIFQIGMFLGYWFIKKALWSSQAHIKSNAASLKKFYAFMYENGEVSKADLEELKEEIKEEIPEWLATMERYDDPSIESMFEVWGEDDFEANL